MNTRAILEHLEAERDALDKAIAALQDSRIGQGRTRRHKRRLSAQARKRISEGMKKRWAARKKSA